MDGTYSIGEKSYMETSPKVAYSHVEQKVKALLRTSQEIKLHYYDNNEAGLSSVFSN